MSRSVVVEADGGSRGNPGPAGYGAVVRDASTGEVLREVAAGIGTASNNVAEYRGLIAGLQAALDVDASDVLVRMDSLLVVNQMSSVWKIKHEAMRPLASEAAALVRQFGSVRFEHVPRERNGHADRLANEAMDDAAAGREWTARKETNTTLGWSTSRGRATSGLLVRHGETPLSVERRFSGSSDPGLSERGMAQAAAIGRRLSGRDVRAVVSSPLRRTRQTADAIAQAVGADMVIDDDIRETDFGDWEEMSFGEIRERWPDALTAWLGNPDIAPPGGESFTQTFARVRRARERILSSYQESTVVLVSHVTPIKSLMRDALEASASVLFRLHLDPASLSIVDWYADGPAVVRLANDTSHLGDDLSTPPA